MNLLSALLALPPVLTGPGVNHEGESFLGRMELQPLVGKRAVLIHYAATRPDGKHLHKEATLLAFNEEGELSLWPVMEELPFVVAHPEIDTGDSENNGIRAVFASGPRSMIELFREEITIEIQDKKLLKYSHAWGMPHGEFKERSTCTLSPGEA